jgi:hypothetical protein
MAIQLNCTDNKCKKWQEPKLDPKTNIAYCSVCGAEQVMSHFTKVQLKAVGQVRQAMKSAFSVKCQKCKWDALPALLKGQLVCTKCSTAHTTISKPFESLIKQEISKQAAEPKDNE